MIKKNTLFLLVLLSFKALAFEESTEIMCFTSYGEKPINIKYVTLYSEKDKAYLGYVKYEKSDTAIPINFVKDNEIPIETRPSIYTIVWNEIIKGEINGTYTVISQGARFSGFTYKNKEGKEIEFNENWHAYDEKTGDCIWK
ncbi:hypothetical protein [Xenorhabdus griffiniae]|uniref:Uncharacterized protein n=2 Tax=Xenorhabdus griffiniae TaxID=351672 RepID=A0ABY9XGK5_9GAMM|nr:hypothetical protein [Xenorhabdus griffiniae]MBD1229095.1 hypothetical protein [Xenorhabdus griffiniae]WMV72003.1 hypothetical protein QL128_18100 [Xenorhabdus griffiniae]WNH01681.1 hypothetical protein QL112_018110 [Xenorhabdus griffiniae]